MYSGERSQRIWPKSVNMDIDVHIVTGSGQKTKKEKS